jgi:hypothetical protein
VTIHLHLMTRLRVCADVFHSHVALVRRLSTGTDVFKIMYWEHSSLACFLCLLCSSVGLAVNNT